MRVSGVEFCVPAGLPPSRYGGGDDEDLARFRSPVLGGGRGEGGRVRGLGYGDGVMAPRSCLAGKGRGEEGYIVCIVFPLGVDIFCDDDTIRYDTEIIHIRPERRFTIPFLSTKNEDRRDKHRALSLSPSPHLSLSLSPRARSLAIIATTMTTEVEPRTTQEIPTRAEAENTPTINEPPTEPTNPDTSIGAAFQDPFASQRSKEEGGVAAADTTGFGGQDPGSLGTSPPDAGGLAAGSGSPPRDRRMSREWDASKVPPSQFQKRKGSVYSTPASRDHRADGNDITKAYHAKLKEKGWLK
ncbi:MAG: hypothetical protein M1824_003078 [Vezdaea acicularis]|nr:MAG: hypothetical protein M1824_003078 [Vezdaea acicularis]